jgi:puromycin-sensitive aminopeptidase
MSNPKPSQTLSIENAYRLPETVTPISYEIKLNPDLAGFKFSGSETIALNIRTATNEILFNAIDLQIENVRIEKDDDETCETAQVKMEKENERVRLVFPTTLAAGNWHLKLDFSGEINDKLRGFYRSAQALKDGEKSWIALTQFEATDARRAFPCFDEPSFKATFKLTLCVDKDLTALSNTSVESETIEGNKKTITFAKTMKMSTYIVAFVVGHLEMSEAVMVDGIPMRIYAPMGKLHLTKFALEIGAAALAFFNKYYGIPYPGDKMDMIAVPDFAFGAMENVGAIIYRESALLVDTEQASHAELERIADVVAHELAHMWFGNLTTMKWWNGIWLNEAFATFMELVAVDNLRPNWKRWESFGASRAMAFATDGLRATRPIEFPVNAPEEANGMFDVLTYEKGASVLRMLEQFIGPEKFKSGVNSYLQKHKFANTETNDLWQSLEAASGAPVQEIMNSWIFQEGYPMVSASLNADKKSITLDQTRFYYLDSSVDGKGGKSNGKSDSKSNDKAQVLYQVPILLRAKLKGESKLVEKTILLKESETNMSFENDLEWLVINAGGSGFYRVNYSVELLENLKAVLPQLSALERFNLVSDLWALTMNGTVKLNQFLQFTKLFKEETDKNVWSVIVGALQYCDRAFSTDKEAIEHLRALTIEILSPTYKRLGWEAEAGEGELTKQLRGLTIAAMGTTGGEASVVKEAASRYDKHLSGAAQLAPDVLSAVVAVLASNGDKKRYEQFEASFKNGSSPQEQERYMYALGMFQDSELLEKTLAKTLAGEVKGQNAPYLVRNIMLNPQGRKVGWLFVKNNWEQINKTFPSLIMTRLVEGVTGLLDEALAKEVFAFFEKYEFAGGQKTVDQHLEKLKVGLAFIAKQKGQLNL